MALTSLFLEKGSSFSAERLDGRAAGLVAPGALVAGAGAAILFALLAAPRGAHIWLLLLCFVFWCAVSGRPRLRARILSGTQWRAVIVVAAMIVLAGARSPDPVAGLFTALGVSAALLMTATVAGGLIHEGNGAWCRSVGLLGAHAIFVGALFVVVDLLTNQAVVTAVVDQFPILIGNSLRHVRIEDDRIVGVYRYVLNRNVGVLNLVAWPALALYAASARSWKPSPVPHLVLWAFALTVLAATFLSEHESSKAALVAAVVVFAVAYRAPRGALQLARTGWIVACLLVVPITQLAYTVHLENAEALPKSARGRVVNWHNISNHVSEAPIFGIGLDATRHYSDLVRRPQQCGELCLRETWRHPHNVYLQIWYELGVVGVAIFMAAGLGLLRLLSRAPPALLPFALATFASAATMIAFSWSIWQLWFFSAISISALLLALAHCAWGCPDRDGGKRANSTPRFVAGPLS